MCGIAGIYPSADVNTVAQMINLQSHRGPDGQGIYQGQNIILGQNRLAVVSDIPHPLPLQRGHLVIAFNGEITNYRELAKTLGFWDFKTDTDTEVILAAYSKWGSQCVDHLEGMFAFFIWDESIQEGFAARDPVGVKPFFFNYQAERFTFASEIKAILHAIPKPGLNEEVIVDTLIAPYFSGALNTPFKDVEVLPPGHTLKLQSKVLHIEEYYHYQPQSKNNNKEHFGEELTRSIKDNLRAHKMPGLFLSGGLDSSIIASQASHQEHFIIDFANHETFKYDQNSIVNSSDTDPALEVSSYTSGNTHIIKADTKEVINGLNKAIAAQSSIVVWPQEISQQILAMNASRYCKSILVGDAADETNFGYFFLLKPDICQSPDRIFDWFGVPILNRKWHERRRDLSDYYIKVCQEQGYNWSTEPQLSVSYLISRYWLGRLLLNGDIHTMNNSLEARVPFANRNILEVAQSFSMGECFNGHVEKFHLREFAKDILPEQIVRRKKSALPFHQMMRFRDMLNDVSLQSKDFLRKFLDLDHLMMQPESMNHFRAYTLARWYNQHGQYYE